jgi:hypothetical protein
LAPRHFDEVAQFGHGNVKDLGRGGLGKILQSDQLKRGGARWRTWTAGIRTAFVSGF